MSNDSQNKDSKYHVKRHDDREVFDRNAVNALLDSEYVAHVGFIDADINEPFVIPMAFARDNDRILLHGSTGSRLMMQLAKGAQMCVTVTKLSAIIVAKSAFNSSMNYESVMIFGQGKRLEDSEKLAAMDLITEVLVPGMVNYARSTTAKEAAGTMIIEVPIEKYSLKSRTGGVMDEPEDKELPIWSGILPLSRSYGEAETAPDSVGVTIPAHILAKIGQNGQS
jgi:nitroimidazol reductase NimA-like FMN-containing flavoprotein (pyridoxamine 5'-phosphate oxidase superfamily)